MCASYGLDPRFTDDQLFSPSEEAVLDALRSWGERNAGETVRPTGRNLRNLNPIVQEVDGETVVEPAWWGFLVDGAPARFPSINTRSERLQDRPGSLRSRALVPATGWYEMQKPARTWHEFAVDHGALFGMAAVTQRGRTADGEWFTCYSLVMRPAPAHLAEIHDRMPVLIPTAFARDWLTAQGDRELIDEALLAAATLDGRVSAAPRADDKGAERLF